MLASPPPPSHFLSGSGSLTFEAPPVPLWGAGVETGSGAHIPNKITSLAERRGSSWMRARRLRCPRARALRSRVPFSCRPLEPRRQRRVPAPRLSRQQGGDGGPQRSRKEEGEIRETSYSGRTRLTGSGQGGARSGAPGVGGGFSGGRGAAEAWAAGDPSRRVGSRRPCAHSGATWMRRTGSPGPSTPPGVQPSGQSSLLAPPQA